MTTVELADRLTSVTWDSRGSKPDISRFLKEFRGRSEQASAFIDKLCLSILQWFSVASSEVIWGGNWFKSLASENGGTGLLTAASFAGHLIECGLIDHELVRRYIIKPLTTHYYNKSDFKKQTPRAHTLYMLFTTAGTTLLRGFLEPEEVQECFDKFKTRVAIGSMILSGLNNFDATKLNVQWGPCLYVCTQI